MKHKSIESICWTTIGCVVAEWLINGCNNQHALDMKLLESATSTNTVTITNYVTVTNVVQRDREGYSTYTNFEGRVWRYYNPSARKWKCPNPNHEWHDVTRNFPENCPDWEN